MLAKIAFVRRLEVEIEALEDAIGVSIRLDDGVWPGAATGAALGDRGAAVWRYGLG